EQWCGAPSPWWAEIPRRLLNPRIEDLVEDTQQRVLLPAVLRLRVEVGIEQALPRLRRERANQLAIEGDPPRVILPPRQVACRLRDQRPETLAALHGVDDSARAAVHDREVPARGPVKELGGKRV